MTSEIMEFLEKIGRPKMTRVEGVKNDMEIFVQKHIALDIRELRPRVYARDFLALDLIC